MTSVPPATPEAIDVTTTTVHLAAPVTFSGVPGAVGAVEAVEFVRLTRPANAVPERAPLFDKRLLVGLYGTPAGYGLGILGTASATATVAMAREQALAYQILLTDTEVIPVFHMVTTIADAYPGADGDYNHRVLTSTVQQWIDVANAHGVWSVIDIQPGHGPITVELAHVAAYIRQPNVHLAVDPEFVMSGTHAIPGARIGTMHGETINLVQAWLNDIARAMGQRKMLIIHQFDDRMIDGKEFIEEYPLVELVWDADGFGSPHPKIADYRQYAGEPGFEYGGLKIFYHYDLPVMTPSEVLRLDPLPVFVVYQ